MGSTRFIKNRPMTIGGEEHRGWLPAGAATPLPTPIRHLLFNFETQFDEDGYLLCYEATGGTVSGDTWHRTLSDAENAAQRWFGMAAHEWESK